MSLKIVTYIEQNGRLAKNLITQCTGGILNKIGETINETYAGLKCMPQGSRIHFV